ncbi:exopolysaccharide biosynthesis protein, partial [Bacillus amyloliquefaciens]|nr:exopolysaccharide biosynthesis protein [Bacillus amyloliquefaciens]
MGAISSRAPRLMPAQPPPNDDLRRFSDVLEDLGHAPEAKLTMAELVASFGERGFGAMILILSLLALLPWPPGGKAVF